MVYDAHLLQAALVGYQVERDRLDTLIADLQARIRRGGGRSAGPFHKAGGSGNRHAMSPEARERIAAAQRKRWAAYRKDQNK